MACVTQALIGMGKFAGRVVWGQECPGIRVEDTRGNCARKKCLGTVWRVWLRQLLTGYTISSASSAKINHTINR